MNIAYRIADESDLAQLAELRWDLCAEGEEVPLVSKPQFLEVCTVFLQRAMAGGQWTYWVAHCGEEVVATAFVYAIQSVPRPCRLQGGWGYTTNVYTKPAHRNQGVGSALMAEVVQWAEERDLELLIVSPSERSVPFYQRAGFGVETDFMQVRLRDF